VSREVRGKQVYLQANQKAAIFPELQGLFAKTVGLVDILRESLMPFADQTRAALSSVPPHVVSFMPPATLICSSSATCRSAT
jgi:hypothetical protein